MSIILDGTTGITSTGITETSDGNVGIGTTSPLGDLTITRSDAAELVLQATGAGGNAWFVQTGNTGSTINGALRFYDYNASAERLRIDSAGRVTMPYQPAFQVILSGTQSISALTRTKIAFDTIDYQNGSNFNTTNNRFTAPVTGWYSFSCWAYGYTVANNELTLFKNGGLYLRSQWAVGSNLNNCNAILVATTKLTAGDYVEMFTEFNTSGAIYHSADRPTIWTGYLVA